MRSKEKTTLRALKDICENIFLALEFVAGIDFERFIQNREKIYAVTRCLEIISEASRRLPDDMRLRHGQIAWQDIASAGNVYRHEYEQLEDLEIWNTVQIDLPPLMAIIEKELGNLLEA